MEKINKYLLVILLTSMLFFIVGCGAGSTTTELATLKGTYKLEGETVFSGISVSIVGPQVYPLLNPDVSGNFSLQVEPGNYTVQASQSGFDNSTTVINVSTGGSTYDLGVQWLGSTAPPGPPEGL